MDTSYTFPGRAAAITQAELLLGLLDDYQPKRHEGGHFDQNFGTGTVPLCHARWLLEDIVANAPDYDVLEDRDRPHYSYTVLVRRITLCEGILFSFDILDLAKGGQCMGNAPDGDRCELAEWHDGAHAAEVTP